MPQKEYPPFFEKAIPIAMVIIGLLILVVLVVTVLIYLKII